MNRIDVSTGSTRSFTPVAIGVTVGLLMANPTGVGSEVNVVRPEAGAMIRAQKVIVQTDETFYNFSNSPTGQIEITSEPTFENTVQQFYTKLLSKQESLGKEFEEILFNNLSDLYES